MTPHPYISANARVTQPLEPPDDPIYRAVLALRDESQSAAMIAQEWQRLGWTPPANLSVRILQTHYRPFLRARLLVEATFQHPQKPQKASTQFLYVQVYPDAHAAQARLEAANRKRCLKCFGPPVFALEHARAVAWALPNGPRLRPLKSLLRWRLFRQMLREEHLAEAEFKLRGARPKLLRYVPRRRALARFRHNELGPRALYFKAYRPREDARALDNLTLLNSSLTSENFEFDVPHVVRHVARRRTIIMREVLGRSLSEVLPAIDPEILAGVGRAIASLHRSSLKPLAQWSATREFRDLRAAMRDVTCALPGLQERIDALLDRLRGSMGDLEFDDESPIHGNLFGDQILINQERVGIVDWDDLSLGDPLYDLGRLVAHMIFISPRLSIPSQRLTQMIQAMLAGYLASSKEPGIDVDRLQWHIAVALLMRAKITALRTLEPHWIETIEASINEAERALGTFTPWLPCSARPATPQAQVSDRLCQGDVT